MSLLVVFSFVLLLAVLISSLAARSVLSTSVLFLVAGFVAGPGMLHAIDVSPDQPSLSLLVTLALFSVLFTDGMHVGWNYLRSAWRLPGRVLLLGMPLTMLFNTLAACFFLKTTWMQGALLGAILSPTDPVFASAIVGRQEISRPLRQLLNVESGINDGLALPIVIVCRGGINIHSAAGRRGGDVGKRTTAERARRGRLVRPKRLCLNGLWLAAVPLGHR